MRRWTKGARMRRVDASASAFSFATRMLELNSLHVSVFMVKLRSPVVVCAAAREGAGRRKDA